MTARLKDYAWTDMARASDEARHPDGRQAQQVTVVVRTTSWKRAAELAGTAYHHAMTYGSTTASVLHREILDAVGPDVVVVHPMSPSGTVRGEPWVIR